MATKEHLELSDFIRSVHQDLRTHSKDVGPNQAWLEHCKNEERLKKYASAMKDLATKHWVKNHSLSGGSPENRIDWVVSHCQHYFFFGDREDEIKKEIVMAEKHEIAVDQSIYEHLSRYKIDECKLKLLDVGSCYNPFKEFSLFNVAAVDLCPASKDVIQCDFLNAEINEDHLLGVESSDEIMKAEGYDAVVFSLFLEYLPSPEQRFTSCQKAYRLLTPSGLLFILTPDSKHATANSKLMKSWRICLSSLGFTRVYYEKLKHLHCMAFKKTLIHDLPLRWFSMKNGEHLPAEIMLKIPQDSLESIEAYTDIDREVQHSTEVQVAEAFSILPQGDGSTSN